MSRGLTEKESKMITIILGAIVSMLVFFFQRWWTAHHPITPSPEARAQFVSDIERPRHFWMGKKRGDYAGKLFDKFKANYEAKIHQVKAASILSEEEAGELAASFAEGLTLTPEEL